MRWLAHLAVVLAALVVPVVARGEAIDRVLYVFDAPETGGAAAPRIIFARELAFEARLEAIATGEPLLDASGTYAARHLRAALDRHLATDLLAHLPVELPPRSARSTRLEIDACETATRPPDAEDLDNRIRLTRAVLLQRVKGSANLRAALEAEGLNDFELQRLLRREALAARYLDLMITPMLVPNDEQLREVLRSSGNPFHGKPFATVRCELRRWVIGQRLATALAAFLQSSRPRVHLRRVP